MQNKKILSSFFIVIIFFILGFFLIKHFDTHELKNTQEIKIAGQVLKADLAITPAQQEQGLSGRKNLEERTGMLFVFDTPGKYAFWMKDMLFPIDIIWLSSDMHIVYIKKNALPELYPETYGPGVSDHDAKYVLEVVSGFADKNNLKIGDSAEFR